MDCLVSQGPVGVSVHNNQVALSSVMKVICSQQLERVLRFCWVGWWSLRVGLRYPVAIHAFPPDPGYVTRHAGPEHCGIRSRLHPVNTLVGSMEQVEDRWAETYWNHNPVRQHQDPIQLIERGRQRMVWADSCGESSGISRETCGNKLKNVLNSGVSCGGVSHIIPGDNVAVVLGGWTYAVQLHYCGEGGVFQAALAVLISVIM